MFDTVVGLFTGNSHRRKAVVGLARILNRHDVANMCYEEGLVVDRRDTHERKVAWGVWLFPVTSELPNHELQLDTGLPAVTQDLRREGIGVMTPMKLQSEEFIIAMPEEECSQWPDGEVDEDRFWTFFRCEVRHNTRVAGGWFHLGLQVTDLVKPDGAQRADFRQHIAAITREVDN